MGGHGGLNILPQKRWNVYNYENREKVRRDEEAAAKEEQLKQEQARKRDAEFRLERLRASRGLAPLTPAKPTPEAQPEEPKASNNHINLFEGIKIFDPVKIESEKGQSENSNKIKRAQREKEEVRVVTAEDEKYRLGYGVAGKGVKLPWYLEKKGNGYNGKGEQMDEERGEKEEERQSGDKKRKKSLEELREERLRREKREKERERALLVEKNRLSRRETEGRRRFSRR